MQTNNNRLYRTRDGIVAGVGDGKFDPIATVTSAQAVLMLRRALGYFQSAADFGNDWMLAATA